MSTDPRRLYDAKDMEGAILYVKRLTGSEDAYPLLANSDGSLIVSITSGTIAINTTGLATGLPDNSAYSGSVTYGTVIMGVRQDTPVTNFDGYVGAVRMSLNREVFTQIRDAAGNNRGVNVDANGSLNVVLTSTLVTVSLSPTTVTVAGTVSLSSTAVTASLSSTIVTAQISSTSSVVTAHISPSASVVTVHISPSGSLATVSLTSTIVTVAPQAGTSFATTAVTITNGATNIISVNVATATLGTVTTSLSSTIVTVAPQAGTSFATTAVTITNGASNILSVNVATATLGTVTVSLANTAVSISTSVTYSSIMLTSKTLTTGSGTLSATNGTITFTPTNRAKIYAISLTTTSATELICIFNSGGVANGVELWRATLMAPAGASAGLNLAVSPPNFLFQSRSGTAVSLSLNTATLIHYSVSYFDEA